jgi:hypothetical protein
LPSKTTEAEEVNTKRETARERQALMTFWVPEKKRKNERMREENEKEVRHKTRDTEQSAETSRETKTETDH